MHFIGCYRWESLDGLLLQVILVKVELCVVNRQSTRGAVRSTQQRLNWNDRNTLVRPISRVLEVKLRSPIVAMRISTLLSVESWERRST